MRHAELGSASHIRMGFTYIMSNSVRAVLYVGVTSSIRDRVLRHKVGKGSGFTSKYNCTDLLHFEEFPDMTEAIQREKQLKRWHREWKLNLIRENNPELQDLACGWYSDEEVESARKFL